MMIITGLFIKSKNPQAPLLKGWIQKAQCPLLGYILRVFLNAQTQVQNFHVQNSEPSFLLWPGGLFPVFLTLPCTPALMSHSHPIATREVTSSGDGGHDIRGGFMEVDAPELNLKG